jgi:hypothetical protein
MKIKEALSYALVLLIISSPITLNALAVKLMWSEIADNPNTPKIIKAIEDVNKTIEQIREHQNKCR